MKGFDVPTLTIRFVFLVIAVVFFLLAAMNSTDYHHRLQNIGLALTAAALAF